MKYFLSILVVIVSCIYIPHSQAYTLSNTDYDLLDHVEGQILDIVDASNNTSIDDVIAILENIQNTRSSLTDKQKSFLEVMIADMYRYAGYDEDEEDYETLTADDCYDDEYFDEEDERCYLKEGDDDIDEDTDFEYNQEFDEESHNDHNNEDSYDDDIKAEYTNNAGVLTLKSGKANAEYEKARQDFKELFPTRTTAFIDTVQFFDSDESETGAYVERTNNEGKTRLVAFNMSAIREGGTEELYIHEMGHIITLEKSQITASTPTDAGEDIMERHAQKCTTHYVFEGCLSSSSYFFKFVGKFWSEDMINKIENEQDVYKGYEDNFLTEYAATNPGEDIAESFAYFVSKSQNHGIAGEAGKKIDFFYNFPELVSLRTYIRKVLNERK